MDDVNLSGQTSNRLGKYHETNESLEILTQYTADFTSYLHFILLKSGFSHDESTIHHRTFLHFMHLALLNSCQTLQKLKSNVLLQELNEEENKYLHLFEIKSNRNHKIEPKLNDALKVFNADVLKYLRRVMRNNGFEAYECEENHNTYVYFFSSFFLIEAKRFLRYKSECQNLNLNSDANASRQKNEPIAYLSKKDRTNFEFGNLQLSKFLIQLVSSTNKHFIYRVSSKSSNSEKRTLKVLKKDCPPIEDVQNLINELVVANEISCYAFRQAFMKTTYQNKKSILLEWVDGFPLNEIGGINISTFMSIAREITSGVLAMHMKEFCHMNLTSEHILYNQASNAIKIISSGSSLSFRSKRKYNYNVLEKDLRYISPEQTGRLNREVDFRSDFYSLGIILYRLLKQRYPFETENKLKLINMHISLDISLDPLKDGNNTIPISDLIFKLLNKEADERYQSAKGIMHDIDLIISEIDEPDEVQERTTLSLRQHDISEILLFPQKLYGRSTEYNTMISILNRIKTSHSFETLFIKGNSATGKSALVSELYRSVVPNGSFICGKYDISKCTPYMGLLEAMNIFCGDLLLEDEQTKAKYKTLLQNAVGDEGKVLTDVITNLNLIIGEQPAISNTYGLEAKNRFNYVFIKFIEVICSVRCPLVLVLDDLHWIDLESLGLLRFLVKRSIKNLMLIGIYRDNEIDEQHPLTQLLNDLHYTEIKLLDMDHETTNDLISDTLSISPLRSYSLCSFIHAKTKGSPFFVKQMLHSLVEQNLITFNIEKRGWQWKDEICGEELDVAENMHELLRRKILSFNKYTQQTFKIACILGSPFSLSSLKCIINHNESVEAAISSGLIKHVNGSDAFGFAHDQIQQAAYSLLPDNPLQIFLYVGKKMLANLAGEKLNEHIFVVVNLLYRAIDIMDDQTERHDAAKLFMLAGENAMTSTAFERAFKYFKGGIKLLSQDGWELEHKLSFDLHSNAARAAYCVANYAFCLKYIEKIFRYVFNDLDLVAPNLLLIRMYNDKRMNEDAIDTAVRILDKLGEKITVNQNESTTASIVEQTKNLVGRLSSDDIFKLKPMEDKRLLSVMEILHSILYSCYFSNNPCRLAHISSRMLQLTFLHGISKYTCLSICAFATVLSGRRDKSAYDYGKMSMSLVEKLNLKEMIPLVKGTFYGNINPFFASIHDSIKPMMKMTCISLEIGSHHFSIACAGTYVMLAFLCGTSLTTLIDNIDQLERVLPMKSALFSAVHQATLDLINETQNPSMLLSGEKFVFRKWFDEDRQQSDVSRVSAFCCVVSYMFNAYDAASHFIEICRPLVKYFATLYLLPIFYFYDGLVSLSFARNGKDEERHVKNAQESIAKLKCFCDNAPQNYQNKVCFLEAELAVVEDNKLHATSQYQRAISLSNTHGFLNEEALALERAGIYYLELNYVTKANILLLRSYKCYETLDASSKTHQLLEKYPSIVAALNKPSIPLDSYNREEIRVHADLEDTISLLTDDASKRSLDTRRDTKRICLSLDD